MKTKVQQRALAGERYRGVIETLTRLIRGESIVLIFTVILEKSHHLASCTPCLHLPPLLDSLSQVAIVGETLTPVPLFTPGPDPQNPKPLLAGIGRLYRGLGVSAVRSITTHGLLWTIFDLVSNYIDHLPVR